MTDNERKILKERMTEGFSDLTPDCWDEIRKSISDPGSTDPMVITERRTYKRLISAVSVVAAVVLIVSSFLVISIMNKITSELYIDVNPSVCISIRKNGKVAKVEGINDDGRRVVEAVSAEPDSTGDLEKTVERLISEINNEGYFSNGNADILLSLCYKVPEDTSLLERAGTAAMKCSSEQGLRPGIILRSFEKDEEKEAAAANMGISVGKYEYITSALKDTGSVPDDISVFAEMSTREIDREIKDPSSTEKSRSDFSGSITEGSAEKSGSEDNDQTAEYAEDSKNSGSSSTDESGTGDNKGQEKSKEKKTAGGSDSSGKNEKDKAEKKPSPKKESSGNKDTGKKSDKASENPSGNSSDKSPGKSPEKSSGNSSGKSSGNSSGKSSGNSSDKSPENPSGKSSGNSSDKSPGKSSGNSSNNASENNKEKSKND